MSIEKNLMQAMQASSYLAGESADYIDNLYEQYLKDPSLVPADWQNYFESLAERQAALNAEVSHADIRKYFLELAKHPVAHGAIALQGDAAHERKQAQVKELIYAYRALGHFQAKLDPLGLAVNPPVPELDLQSYDLTEADLDVQFIPDHFADGRPITLRKLVESLRAVYCGTIGAEYMHITSQTEVRWLQQRLESPEARPVFSADKKRRIFTCLMAAEVLEKYLGAKYVGQKRFSLEGNDSLVPLLDEILQQAGKQQVKEIVIGMAHRGRLNVLVNIVGKAPQELFLEFEGKLIDNMRSGDVKYHMGFSSDVKTSGGIMHLALAFNPSHLEIISPVVEGSVRARQQRRGEKHRHDVLPVQIHGDAAFAGQGVVMETFSLSQTKGYTTGGTIHIIVNNQIGFTTDPCDARSTFYCTDVAKMVQAPIFHVNADDAEAVLFIAQLALDYRKTFSKDIVIDLIGYRRHGHNEADEPAATQPVMYQKIKQQITAPQKYSEKLIQENILTKEQINNLVLEYRTALDAGRTTLPSLVETSHTEFTVDWTPYLNQKWNEPVNTAVNTKTLKQLATTLYQLPEGMVLQPQVAKIIEDNRKMTAGELPLNWGYAETLAYATLLNEEYSIRISGQDAERGTFAHRHAVLHDYQNGNIYVPLQRIPTKKATFQIIDSILSEEAVVAFEYGYASADPRNLVIWEAQFGDFANGAQVVIDQFISSGDQKWGRLCGLVMLLPHGYEGLGPEHSSARLERYLQLCAQDNMQVCVPSTPAQVFHMIRRQMLRRYRKPLIVMTPKSVLRNKLAVSSLDELSKGQFNLVMPEIDDIKEAAVKRVILCSGKVYYDLLDQRRANKQENIAVIRIEQLYPFPAEELRTALAVYKKVTDIIWCQEEPQNQGAWNAISTQIQACLSQGQELSYIGREAAAAPAVGSGKLHIEQQKKLVAQALKI